VIAILYFHAIFDFLEVKKGKKTDNIRTYRQTNLLRETQARALHEREMKDICSKIYTFDRSCRWKLFFATFNSRGKKLYISIQRVGASATRETRPVFQRARQLRCSQVGTCLQCNVIYSHGRSLRVIYIYRQNTVADNLEYVFSRGCSSLAPARSYL